MLKDAVWRPVYTVGILNTEISANNYIGINPLGCQECFVNLDRLSRGRDIQFFLQDFA